MAHNSDQIQADIARTRTQMSARLDSAGSDRPVSSGLTGNIADQVRQRPIVAIGLSLLAGKLLQDYLGGSQGTSRSTSTRYGSAGGYPAPYGQSSVAQARDAISSGASSATNAVGDVASQAMETTRNVASSVADTASDVAGTVADTASDVARQVVDTTGDAAEYVTDTAGDLVSTISDQIRRQPLVALGLSIAASSLLTNYYSKGEARSGSSYSYGESYSYDTHSGAAPPRPSQMGSSVAGATRQATGTARSVAGGVVDTTQDIAGSVADTAGNFAGAVADTAGDVASTVADTASGVARQVADTTSNVVDQVVETTGDAAEYVSDTVTDFIPTVMREVRERPLAALGLAMAAGMFLQPTLAPTVTSVTRSVTTPVRGLSSSLGEVLTLPEPNEAARIRQALVPATVERAKEFTTREMRDYLENNLESVVGQTSLRAGVVAAISERAEGFVEKRLPSFLESSLTGTRGLLALALAGAVLKARSQVQQGQGATISNIKTELAQTLTQSAREELERHFPAFREQYKSEAVAVTHCPNCGSEVANNSRFCPSCGKAQA